jgi:hypothetical protein
MFFAAHANGSYSPLELSGVGSSLEIKSLQQSLARLAKAVARPNALPGPTNGVLGEQTMISIAGLLDKFSSHLPMWVVHPVASALTLGVSSTEAKNTIGRYVTEIRYAVDKATAHIGGQLPQLPQFDMSEPTMLQGFFDPGWYLIPSRLLVIGGIALIGIWLVTRKKG